jgi:hypothetical protein
MPSADARRRRRARLVLLPRRAGAQGPCACAPALPCGDALVPAADARRRPGQHLAARPRAVAFGHRACWSGGSRSALHRRRSAREGSPRPTGAPSARRHPAAGRATRVRTPGDRNRLWCSVAECAGQVRAATGALMEVAPASTRETPVSSRPGRPLSTASSSWWSGCRAPDVALRYYPGAGWSGEVSPGHPVFGAWLAMMSGHPGRPLAGVPCPSPPAAIARRSLRGRKDMTASSGRRASASAARAPPGSSSGRAALGYHARAR